MISSKFGHAFDPLILKIYRLFFGRRILNPNTLTVLAALFGFLSFISIALGFRFLSAAMLFISCCFDLMDGALARNTGCVTPFGGFLDSVLDRYTDLLIMFGVCIYFLKHGENLYAIFTFAASIGIAVIPYAKARAEAASLNCNTGFLERPERLILLFIGLSFNILPYVVIILAVLTHATVIQRIVFVKRQAG